LTIYFCYVGKNWVWTVAFGAALQAISLANLYLFVPESPQWLYDKHRYSECQAVLRYMAAFNGVTLKPDSCLVIPLEEHYVDPYIVKFLVPVLPSGYETDTDDNYLRLTEEV